MPNTFLFDVERGDRKEARNGKKSMCRRCNAGTGNAAK